MHHFFASLTHHLRIPLFGPLLLQPQDNAVCGFCETAVQYVKIALHNNQTLAQIEHAVDQLCDSAFAGLDAGPSEVCVSAMAKQMNELVLFCCASILDHLA